MDLQTKKLDAYCEVLIIDDRGFIYGFILPEGLVQLGSKIP